MKYIELTQGKRTIVDDEDFEWLSQWKWHLSYYGYANRRQHLHSSRKHQKFNMIKMHRLIIDAPNGLEVDHINGDKLDNRRANLRVVTHAQNMCNSRVSSRTGYKGVSKCSNCNRYTAQVAKDHRHYYLGIYDTPEKAAIAYDKKAKELHGEYARLNFA